MDAATITATTFTLKQGSTAVTGTVANTGTEATFTPASGLAGGTVYTATITTGATDVAGNPLAANVEWAFITIDAVAPTVISTFPTNVATDVAININISATFSEAMLYTTIAPANFTLTDGTTEVLGSVTYDAPNKTAVFAPSTNLAAATNYTATVTTAVTDLSGHALAVDEVWTFTTALTGAGPAPVSLGTAGNFVMLAKTAITNVPASAITGDIGVSPAAESDITGFSQTDSVGYATSTQVTGAIYAADMTPPTPAKMTTAVSDMETAYTDAAGRSLSAVTELGGGTLAGLTLVPGLYTWSSSVNITTNLTLNGAANDVWIFQISGDLLLANSMQVVLSGGALAKNVFWQVAGYASMGTGSHFEGIVMSQTQIILGTGASMNGRALAQSQIVLDKNVVAEPAP
jgi:hypothetical protein